MLTFTDIFVTSDTETRTPLGADAEWALVQAARTPAGKRPGGAYDQLLRQYVPAIRGRITSELQRTHGAADLDEIRSNVLCAFAEVVATIEEGTPVAAAFAPAVLRAASDHVVGALSAPHRMRARYFATMRAADGDAARGAELAHVEDLSVASFWALHDMLTSGATIDGEDAETLAIEHDQCSELDIVLDAARALASLPEGGFGEPSPETVVTRMAYGLDEGDPLSDEAIAEVLKQESRDAMEAGSADADAMLVMSRSSVRRTRLAALDIMHRALCDGDDPRCRHDH